MFDATALHFSVDNEERLNKSAFGSSGTASRILDAYDSVPFDDGLDSLDPDEDVGMGTGRTGTQSPSSFKSDVSLLQEDQHVEPDQAATTEKKKPDSFKVKPTCQVSSIFLCSTLQ